MIRNIASAVMFWSASVVMLFALNMTLRLPVSQAGEVIPVAIVTCSTCEGVSDLQAAALAFWEKWNAKTPPAYVGFVQSWGICLPSGAPSNSKGTDVLVVSTAIAISGGFSACTEDLDGKLYPHVQMIDGSTNADAVENDNVGFGRAEADAGRITMPSNLPFNGAGGSSPVDLWESYLDGILKLVSMEPGLNWHGLSGFPQVMEGTFTNIQTGVTFKIWDDDTITVTDQNGWTAKFQWNPDAPYMWVYVENSMRDQNGKPVNVVGANPPTSGGIAQPVGALDLSLPGGWGGMSIFAIPMYSDDGPATGTITVGPLQDPTEVQCAAITTNDDCQDTGTP